MVHFWTAVELVLVSASVSSTFAALYSQPSQLPTQVYDYIVVGAGTAGNVIANRLTENSGVQVLVLEAGVSNANVLASVVPFLGPTLVPDTIYDWNYTTVNQAGFNGRAVKMPRGRMLGGSSSVNYMTYNRGSLDDFNRLASVGGSPIWRWSALQSYIKKLERFVASADNHDTTGQYTPAIHGTNGPLQISISGFPTYLDGPIIQTTKDLAEFPFNEDMNSGNTIGMGWVQSSVGGGERCSSATAYLAQQYINRPNLHVLINAQVTKLYQTGTVRGLPSFLGVEFAVVNGAPSTSATVRVTARKEVILSAGTIGTPAILQLSGIGDPRVLTPLGIRTLVNNPSVGANLSDHVILFNPYEVNSTQSFDDLLRNSTIAGAAMAEWQASRTGNMVYPVTNQLGWFRLPRNSSIFRTTPDPSAGPTSGHYELIFLNFLLGIAVPPPTGHFVTIATGVITPTARGTVKLASSNPLTAPLVDPRYFSTAFDVFTAVEAVKAVKRYLAGPAWKNIIVGPFGPLASANTDAEILSYVKSNSNAMLHPVGTAAMSPVGAKWGVVDPDLKVKGAHGIRIVDGSVWTYVPAAHTQGPIYILAERAADLIKAS